MNIYTFRKYTMKNLLLLLLSLFSLQASAQTPKDLLLAGKEENMPVYAPPSKTEKQLYLQMNYGSAAILNAAEISKLKGATIAGVDIVYSDYPRGKGFPELTEQRIENLEKLSPGILKDAKIKWRFIRQTACSDKASAQALFHGIVITYRPMQSAAETASELKYLDEILSPKSGTAVSAPDGKYVSHSETFKALASPPEVFATKERDFVVKGALSDAKTGKHIAMESDSVFGTMPTPFTYFVPVDYLLDSTVIKVLNRNKWTNMAITADLTGSMSPYTAQLLLWFKLHTADKKVKQFVFFNDGNMTPDNKKVIGSTGGIYDARASSFEDVNVLARKTMMAGCGGDGPENNVEALLKAIGLCPDCNELIMIADNWAPVKDISLLAKVKKPVRVILCGTSFGINVQYLNLARATGGSVHTMEKDLTELIKLKENEEVVLNKQRFRIEKGVFVLVK